LVPFGQRIAHKFTHISTSSRGLRPCRFADLEPI
jgi:hypothetical protein